MEFFLFLKTVKRTGVNIFNRQIAFEIKIKIELFPMRRVRAHIYKKNFYKKILHFVYIVRVCGVVVNIYLIKFLRFIHRGVPGWGEDTFLGFFSH